LSGGGRTTVSKWKTKLAIVAVLAVTLVLVKSFKMLSISDTK
jgi:hypothetical protein